MPIDLVESDPRIVVHDRTGESRPYSRGIMATSLLATGIATEEAYRLASLVQARLLHHRRHQVEAHELVELVQVTLDEHATDPEITPRWLAWRHAKRSGRPIVIVLCGAPGVGKGTVAARLAVRLDVTRVVSTDAIREVLRLVVPHAVLPELHRSTSELLDDDQPGRFVGFDRQCAAVGDAAVAVARRTVTENRSMILEGVHAIPGATTRLLADHPADPIVVERLVTIDDPTRHAQHLRRRAGDEPLRGGGRHVDRLQSIRSIQHHLADLAAAAGVPTVDARIATDLTQNIVDEIAPHALDRTA